MSGPPVRAAAVIAWRMLAHAGGCAHVPLTSSGEVTVKVSAAAGAAVGQERRDRGGQESIPAHAVYRLGLAV